MGRPIRNASDSNPDNYGKRLLKLIPSEVVGVYISIDALIRGMDKPPVWLLWVVFVLLLTATPLWMIFIEGVKSILQNVMGSISFIIWVMTIGGPFAAVGVPPYIGSILLVLFSGIVFPLLGQFVQNPSGSGR